MTYIIAITQIKGGATKTTSSINILGALLEKGKRALLCDMDKDKPDAIFWADLGNTLNDFVIPLYDDNPKPKLESLSNKYDFIIIDTPISKRFFYSRSHWPRRRFSIFLSISNCVQLVYVTLTVAEFTRMLQQASLSRANRVAP